MSNGESPTVKVVRLHPGAVLPRYMSGGAAGLDLCADFEGGPGKTLPAQERALIGTGIALELPVGYEAQVRPRSGLALKHGVTVLNSPGTIDADYRGEVRVLLVNLSALPFAIKTGDRIAQLVIAPVARAQLVEVDALDPTGRGAGGYGSTGV